MRLELTTYALRKRGCDDGTDEPATDCDDTEPAVALRVALDSADTPRELVRLSDDLGHIAESYPELNDVDASIVRDLIAAALSLVRSRISN